MHIVARECNSAADVRALSREVLNRRRASRAPRFEERIETQSVPIVEYLNDVASVEVPEELPVDTSKPVEPGYCRVLDVQRAVSKVWGIRRSELKSSSRLARLCEPRHVAMIISKRLYDYSIIKIAQHFGGRDHTTVLNAERKIGAYADIVAQQLAGDKSPMAWALAMHEQIFPRKLYGYNKRRSNRRNSPAVSAVDKSSLGETASGHAPIGSVHGLDSGCGSGDRPAEAA